MEFEFVVGGHATPIEGVFDRFFAEEDLVDAFFAGDAFAVATVVVEGLFDLGDVGGFGAAEAKVVVLGAHEFGVEAADRLEEVGAHEAEVEDHEFGEEAIFVVGNLAVFAVVFVGAVFVDDDVVGVDQADVRMDFEIVDGFG